VALLTGADARRLILQSRGNVSVCQEPGQVLTRDGDDAAYARSLRAALNCRNRSTLQIDCQCPYNISGDFQVPQKELLSPLTPAKEPYSDIYCLLEFVRCV